MIGAGNRRPCFGYVNAVAASAGRDGSGTLVEGPFQLSSITMAS
jgi:hypothetical protein